MGVRGPSHEVGITELVDDDEGVKDLGVGVKLTDAIGVNTIAGTGSIGDSGCDGAGVDWHAVTRTSIQNNHATNFIDLPSPIAHLDQRFPLLGTARTSCV